MGLARSVLAVAVGALIAVTAVEGPPRPASGASPVALAELAPGTWYKIPGPSLDSVLPDPLPDIGYNSPEAITTAWNSGALDTKRGRLYVFGGGHADYSGNEVYQFDLRTQRWSRLTEPSPRSAVPRINPHEPSTDVYADGRPASVHTYGMVHYLPSLDAVWLQGGSRWHDGKGSQLTWLLDLESRQWRSSRGFSGHLGLSSAYDPATNRVIAKDVWRYFAYNVATGAYAWVSGQGDQATATYDGHMTGIDRGRRMAVTIGRAIRPKGGLIALDLRSGNARPELIAMTGDTEILRAYAPGLDYDESRQRLVAWHGGGDVYEIDLAARVVRKIPAAGGTPPGPQLENGTFGRWRYVPSEGGFIYVGSIRDAVYFYKSSAPAAGPRPSTSPTPREPRHVARATPDNHLLHQLGVAPLRAAGAGRSVRAFTRA